MECKFCNGELDNMRLIRSSYWTIYLHQNQYYLGRVLIALNRHGPEDTLSVNSEEWSELKVIFDKITRGLKNSFSPDLISYLALQNKDRNHFHFHVIPRYEKERKFNEESFTDELWGKTPTPTPRKEIKEETLNLIKRTIIKSFAEVKTNGA